MSRDAIGADFTLSRRFFPLQLQGLSLLSPVAVAPAERCELAPYADCMTRRRDGPLS